MALQLDVKPARITGRQPLHQKPRLARLPVLQELSHRPLGPAGQADQPLGMALELLQRHLRQLPALVDVKARRELHQIHVARFVLRQQHDRRGQTRPLPRRRHLIGDRNLAPHDRLQPSPLRQNGKFQRREHRIDIGHGDGGHVHRVAQLDQLLHRNRALKQRIFGVHAQVDESGITHCRRLRAATGRGKPPNN